MSRDGGQSLLKFKYNADGIRTNKIVDGANHVYTLNGTQIVSEAWGNFLLIYLYDESGAPIGLQYRTKSYAANVFDTFYFEKNLQGDIIAVYNADGDKIGSYTYDAWGNCTVTVVSESTTLEKNVVRSYNPFRYRGYYYDTETGLYYLQSRYYNPAWGRFLNEDGYISTGTGLLGYNMYAYCNNNPVMGYDPTGYGDVCVEDFNEDNNPFNDLGHPQGRGGGIDPGTAYHTYTVRCQTAAYDGALSGYHSSGVSHAMVNPGYYYVPGAVTVTDDMAVTNDGVPQARFTDKTDPHHVFRKADGHMTHDTPANRALLENATLKKYYRGTDSRGNMWYSYIDPAGRQVWVSARGNSIRNGGINMIPLPWDYETGYCQNFNK